MFAGLFYLASQSLATYNSKWKHRWQIARRIAAKQFYKLMGRRNARLQPHILYKIKAGYHHSPWAEQLDARLSTDEWQKEVYQLAAEIAESHSFQTVIDLGCGSGYKLIKQLGHLHTTGIEVNPTFEWLKQKYPARNWLLFENVRPTELHTDLLICADVIEHLADPDELLDFIQEIDFRMLVISTPERDAVAGKRDYGPPENTAHYREWNVAEFKSYLRQWFLIRTQKVYNAKSVTQVVICQKKL